MSQAFCKSLIRSCSMLAALVISNFAHAEAVNSPEINVGIYAPFSTKSAFIGRNILAAMEMGSDRLNTHGIHYSFYTLDVPADAHNAPHTLQKFIDAHHIQVLLTEGSGNGLMAAPLAKKNNIIHFSMASDPAIADGKNNFLAWSPAAEQANVLIKELQRKQVQQIGIITTNHASVNALTESVVKQLRRSNSPIKISSYEQFNPGTKDFSHLINKIKKSNPDLYFIMAAPEDIEKLQKEMQAAHINKPITSIVERVTPKVMTIFNGQWYIDTHEMKSEFIKEYKEAYLNHPVTEAGYAFDVFQILNQSVISAMKTNKTLSSETIAKQIRTIASGSGVMGPFTFDQNGVLYTKSEVKVIKNGQVLTA